MIGELLTGGFVDWSTDEPTEIAELLVFDTKSAHPSLVFHIRAADGKGFGWIQYSRQQVRQLRNELNNWLEGK